METETHQPSTDSRLSSERMLLRHADPVPSPGDHGLSIDGSETKLVAHSQPGSVGGPVSFSQAIPV